MSTNNAINNVSYPFATKSTTVDPLASSDSYIQLNINGTGEIRIGSDQSASAAFKVSEGSALGTNDLFIIQTTGQYTVALQPSFLATLGTELLATGDGTVHYIGSITATTEIFDRNSDFTPGDGAGTGATFTAPISGTYILMSTISIVPLVITGGLTTTMNINTSNINYLLNSFPTRNTIANYYGPSDQLMSTVCTVAYMDTSDTATFSITSTGGTKVDNVMSGGNVCGFLLG